MWAQYHTVVQSNTGKTWTKCGRDIVRPSGSCCSTPAIFFLCREDSSVRDGVRLGNPKPDTRKDYPTLSTWCFILMLARRKSVTARQQRRNTFFICFDGMWLLYKFLTKSVFLNLYVYVDKKEALNSLSGRNGFYSHRKRLSMLAGRTK